MPLLLTLVGQQRHPPGHTSIVLFENDATIGRAPDNTWVLRDPERVLSSYHCHIMYSDGHYYVIDTSTNGLYLNGSLDRLERGRRARLHNGDRLSLGEYEIEARLITVPDARTASQAKPSPAPAQGERAALEALLAGANLARLPIADNDILPLLATAGRLLRTAVQELQERLQETGSFADTNEHDDNPLLAGDDPDVCLRLLLDPNASLSLPAARLLRNAFKQFDYRLDKDAPPDPSCDETYAITHSDTSPQELS